MAIQNFDNFIAAYKQALPLTKTGLRTTVANGWFSLFDIVGNPGSGTLAGSSSAAGVVPTDATAGCPSIDAFGGSATGYLAQVDFGCTVATRLKLFDMLFKAGAYAYNSGTTTLSSQPSYSGRLPNSSYVGLQIWIEVTTAFATGNNWSLQVTYTNQAGTTGRTTVTTGALAAAGLTQGRMYQLALQAGDTGVQKIESVVATNGTTAMTAGAINVLVLRPLWSGRVGVANGGDIHDLARTAMPIVYTDSALILTACPDSTSSGVIDLECVIANG